MADWNWYDEDGKASTIVPRVDAIAIYTNQNGDIVIRQQDSMDGNDNLVIIPQKHAQVVIDAIRNEMNPL